VIQEFAQLEPLFEPGDLVLVLSVQFGEHLPRPVSGEIIGEDAGGIMLKPREQGRAGDGVYIPYARIETVLLLRAHTQEEERKIEFEDAVQKQRVLDELDRIFFEMTEKKGRYQRGQPIELDPDEEEETGETE
jgi:hypothetical protein